MKVRPFQSTDVPSIAELYYVSVRTLAAPYYSADQLAAWAPAAPDPSRWAQRLAGLRTLIAEVDGRMAGFVSYTEEGYLDLLFTHPDVARRGVAAGLYRVVESALRGGGVTVLTVHASLAARPFFDRQGFVVDVEECVEVRGAQLRRFAMHKDLPGGSPSEHRMA